MDNITVLIADDVPGTREDIKRLLYFEEDIQVVGEAEDGDEAVKLSDSLKPDVILMDVNMPRLDGIRAAEMISEKNPDSAIVMVSIQGEQEYLRKAMMAGARDYLVKPFSSEELASTIRKASSFKKRRLHLVDGKPHSPAAPARDPGRIITFFSTKGGVGKTTAACNLAISLAQATRLKVALLDMDLQGGDISIFMNISARGGLADVVQEAEYADPSLLETYFCPHMSGVRILPAPASPEQADLINATHVENILKAVKDSYDYIVVDTPAAISDVTLACLELSDHILIMFNQDLPALRHARINMEIIEKLNLTPKAKFVLNRFRNDGLKIKELEKNINAAVSATLPEDPEVVLASINKGHPFVLTRPSDQITRVLQDLAGELAGPAATAGAGEQKQAGKTIIGKIFSF
ncbi:MAG: response regulator [Peptococcaceae bacterium]|nr:response regulator [Peptococcaceae bacterium]